MVNVEPVMESAFTRSAEKPIAELTLEMKLGAKQLTNCLWTQLMARR